MVKDKHGNKCTKRLRLSIYTLAQVKFNYFKALEIAEKLYGKHGICFDVVGQKCLALSKADQVKLAVVDGTCKWDQNNSEQDDLYALVKAPPTKFCVFIVGGIKRPKKGPLAGCAGHAPNKPAAVVSGTRGTVYTLAHEVGHVLLTSSYTPVHESSTSNIMVNGTHNIPKGSSPDFDAKQIKQIPEEQTPAECIGAGTARPECAARPKLFPTTLVLPTRRPDCAGRLRSHYQSLERCTLSAGTVGPTVLQQQRSGGVSFQLATESKGFLVMANATGRNPC